MYVCIILHPDDSTELILFSIEVVYAEIAFCDFFKNYLISACLDHLNLLNIMIINRKC